MPLDGTNFFLPPEARIIDEALEILGENGEHWGQGELGNKNIGYCMVGAIYLARRKLKLKKDKTINIIASHLHTDTRHCGFIKLYTATQIVECYNDNVERSFAEVRKILLMARQAAISDKA